MTSTRSVSMAVSLALALGACDYHGADTVSVPVGRAMAASAPASLPDGAKLLQTAELAPAVTDIKSGIPPVSSGDYVVSGVQKYNGWFLSAERIVFKANSKLVFSKAALEARAHFFVLAKEIVSEDPVQPGSINWDEPSLEVPKEIGTADAGTDSGQHEGAPGGVGHAGAAGTTGQTGRDAPTLTLTTLSLKGPIFVNLRGEAGGPGGRGQKGGRGGGGGFGASASQNMFNCTRGAGTGGPGGGGGDGGTGGASGDGGRGGAFTLITTPENLAAASRLLKVDNSGGASGANPGHGGDPGDGGLGGPGGAQQLPWCQGDGSTGGSGTAGLRGHDGSPGSSGAVGDYFVGQLSPASVSELLTKR